MSAHHSAVVATDEVGGAHEPSGSDEPRATSSFGKRGVGVAQLQRAWAAVQRGEFADDPVRPTSPDRTLRTSKQDRGPVPVDTWAPAAGERVICVVGCHGYAGATTVAVAIGTVAARTSPVRVIECSSHTASGLANACDAELGVDDHGWAAGSREGGVHVERPWDVFASADLVWPPRALEIPSSVTVIDAAWEIGQLLATPCWLSQLVTGAPMVVLVTTATVPGIRHLREVAELLDAGRVIAAVVGPRRARWPRGVDAAGDHLVSDLARGDRLVRVPRDASLATEGLSPAPLSQPLLQAAEETLQRLARYETNDKIEGKRP